MPTALQHFKRAKLQPQELAFVLAFCDRSGPCALNPTAAADAAGYANPSTDGPRLLRLRRIARAIDRRIAKRVPGSREVLGEIADLAMAPREEFTKLVMGTDKDGNPIVVSARVDLGPKARMLELLAKRFGHTLDPLQRKVGRLIDLELEALGAGKRQQRARRALKEKQEQKRALKARRLLPPGSPGAAALDIAPLAPSEHDAVQHDTMTHSVKPKVGSKMPPDALTTSPVAPPPAPTSAAGLARPLGVPPRRR